MKRKEPVIELSKEQRKNAAKKIKEYITENFEFEIGNLQSEIFLDYITDNVGVYYYNNAVADSLSFVVKKVDELYLLMKDEEIL